jgi:hypothetical protein
MSIFSTILEKLGIQKPAAPAAPAATAAKPGAGGPGAYTPVSSPKPAAPGVFASSTPAPVSAPKPAPMAMVDVMGKLQKMAGDNPGLDWKVSIVDLLKLLGMDSSFSARKELATELGCPADLMGDSAKMNTWLHKTVLQKIAENGGNIPQSLLS